MSGAEDLCPSPPIFGVVTPVSLREYVSYFLWHVRRDFGY